MTTPNEVCYGCNLAKPTTDPMIGLCRECMRQEDAREESFSNNKSNHLCTMNDYDPDANGLCRACMLAEDIQAITNEYYKSQILTVLVPVTVRYHDATDTVYDWDKPSRDDIELAFRMMLDKKRNKG